ncbi:MAG TPA: hypothetical protein VFK13_07535 [Gemmatimonadaceae bacterium]|nr:hypothetical protein [Gemmatimonadaceae bacterium]
MIGRRLALLSLLAGAVACAATGRSIAPVGQHTVDAAAASRSLLAEYQVYGAVLADFGHTVRVSKRTQDALFCNPSPTPCVDTTPEAFVDAMLEYAAKNASPVVLSPTPKPSTPVEPWKAPAGADTTCWPIPTVTLSRVGLGPDRTTAVVSYDMTVGPGPYPGCGYSAGALLLLRKDSDGSWHIVDRIARWIT